MEFKVFKNENSKILKEYWLTQSEWDALDKTTVQEGDIYHIVGTIDKGDLSADVNASLAKADSSLQKPTTTLAKESFVKVGIDGSQKFDESSYVVAPLADGTAGQVLKKTATGTEWAGVKLYRHAIKITVPQAEIYVKDATGTAATVHSDGEIYVTFINQNSVQMPTPKNLHDNLPNLSPATFYSSGPVDGEYKGTVALEVAESTNTGYTITAYGAVTSVSGKPFAVAILGISSITDTVTEL